MDTLTRRELFRRLGRAVIVGPVVLATREQQADVIFSLARFFGLRSPVGRWLKELTWRW